MPNRNILWILVLLALASSLTGCLGQSKDEEDAYQKLKAKPMTEDQKKMIEKVKASRPAPNGGALPGR